MHAQVTFDRVLQKTIDRHLSGSGRRSKCEGDLFSEDIKKSCIVMPIKLFEQFHFGIKSRYTFHNSTRCLGVGAVAAVIIRRQLMV
jgi:hypothetical protein